MIRKAEQPLSSADAHLYLTEVLAPLCRVFPSTSLYQSAIDIQARYRFGFHDSLIVASALAAGCKRLVTEDLQDGQSIEGLSIQNPFE